MRFATNHHLPPRKPICKPLSSGIAPRCGQMADVEAVIFDLDGLLLESEQVWDEAKRRLVSERGGRWTPEATQTMLGMSSTEWAVYMRDGLGVPLDAARDLGRGRPHHGRAVRA